MTTTSAPHSHRTSTPRTTSNPDAVQLCDTCGRDMAEIRAERTAKPTAAKGRKDTTPGHIEARLADNERRRARYARTGR